MPISPISLGVRSNPARHGADGAARMINCYAEDAGEEGKIRYPIYACDGLSVFSSMSGGGIRAMLALDEDTCYVVAGRIVYKVTSADPMNPTPIGAMDADGIVFMSRNRASTPQISIVSGGRWFVIENDVMTEPNDADLPAPNCVTNIDGYFVFSIPDGRFFITDIDDIGVSNIDFAAAESNPDGLLACATRGRELVLFGPKSIEFHTNTGGDFPFTRASAVNIGLYAVGSVCEMTLVQGRETVDTVAFAATDGQGAYAGVMVLNGYSGAKISTHAVDRTIRDEPDKDSIRSFTWSAGGHTYYCITGSSFTWVYDTATDAWHERASYGLDRWRAVCGTTFGTTNIVGDYNAGIVYRIDHQANDEAGEPLVMTIQPPAVHAWPNPIRFYGLHIDVIPGVGLNTSNTANSHPKIMVAHSDDGGKTFSAERQASIGEIGRFKTRVKLFRFGQSKEDGKVFKISCSAAVVRGITGMAVDATQVKG